MTGQTVFTEDHDFQRTPQDRTDMVTNCEQVGPEAHLSGLHYPPTVMLTGNEESFEGIPSLYL